MDDSNKVTVAPSQIPNAGMGLFANRKYKKGERIVRYAGEVLTEDEVDHKYPDGNAKYVLQVCKDVYIDATNPVFSSLGRFANTAGRGRKNNAKFAIYRKKAIPIAHIVATKTINPGDEIYVAYGNSYHF